MSSAGKEEKEREAAGFDVNGPGDMVCVPARLGEAGRAEAAMSIAVALLLLLLLLSCRPPLMLEGLFAGATVPPLPLLRLAGEEEGGAEETGEDISPPSSARGELIRDKRKG